MPVEPQLNVHVRGVHDCRFPRQKEFDSQNLLAKTYPSTESVNSELGQFSADDGSYLTRNFALALRLLPPFLVRIGNCWVACRPGILSNFNVICLHVPLNYLVD